MRIAAIDTVVVGNPWKNWVYALVRTDDGLVGVGEGTANAFGRTIEAAIHELAPLVLGQDPTRIEWLGRRLVRDVYTDGGHIHRCAAAAIETACWDILGKSLGVPVWMLLGGRARDRVRAYANGWYRCERTPAAIAQAAVEVIDQHFTALKLDPFGKAWRVMDRGDQDLAIDIVAAVREAVGDTVDIMIEGHSRFTVDEAVQIARRLEPFRPMWFEEPVRHDRVSAVPEVARRSAVPIATGESLHTLGDFAELGKAGGVAFWQPDPTHLGGLLLAKLVAGMAEAFDSVVAPHQAGGPVATAVCLNLAACTNNHLIQEYFDCFNEPWQRDLVSWSPELDDDGCLSIPSAPGIGLELNLEVAREHPYSEENFLALFEDNWERRRR